MKKALLIAVLALYTCKGRRGNAFKPAHKKATSKDGFFTTDFYTTTEL
jgi:hypothetical protein